MQREINRLTAELAGLIDEGEYAYAAETQEQLDFMQRMYHAATASVLKADERLFASLSQY